MLAYLSDKRINDFITSALAEDIGKGDHTSLSSVPKEAQRSANAVMKDSGIIAGLALAEKIFHTLDPSIQFTTERKDGEKIAFGDIVFRVHGSAQHILTAERLVLNCLQRMSGIATYTHHLQHMIAHTKARVLDTRKTTPNFRMCEKWAVAIGGGTNHRYCLDDMILLKDNHIDYVGGIEKVVTNCRVYLQEKNLDLQIEVETRNLNEVRDAVHAGVDRIMLDNMSPSVMREAVSWVDGKIPLEASGGITENTIAAVAETGVDFISIGALTHSYKSLDISLKAV